MPSMTPEEAHKLLNGEYQEPLDGVVYFGEIDGYLVQYKDSYCNTLPDAPLEDANLYRRADDMAETIANLEWEYGVEYKYLTNRGAEWRLDPSEGWHKTYRAADRAARTSVQFRIVRRLVSQPEEVQP